MVAIKTMRLQDIVIGTRVRRDMGDLAALANSIKRHGLLHPVVVKTDGTLIAGHRRIEAVRRLGWDEIPVTRIDVSDLLAAENDENSERKDFTPTEAVEIGRLVEEEHRAKIKASRYDWARKGVNNRKNKPFAPQSRNGLMVGRVGTTTVVAGRAVGLGHTAYAQARDVVAAAEKDPQRYGDLPAMMDETRTVSGAYREMRLRAGTPLPVPKKRDRSKRQRGVGLVDREMRAAIWQQLRVALENLASFPSAREVVGIVQAQIRDKQFMEKKLGAAVNWLKEFTDEWTQHAKGEKLEAGAQHGDDHPHP